MRVRIQNEVYTLITIVPDVLTEKVMGINTSSTIAVAYVFDKDRKVLRFPAKDITDVER